MIKRLVDIARANVSAFIEKRAGEKSPEDSLYETQFIYDEPEEIYPPEEPADPLAQYYANLEVPPGSNRESIKSAWKRLLCPTCLWATC